MSNGESKIAIFKVALCYGFAIALRTLFLGIRRCDLNRTSDSIHPATYIFSAINVPFSSMMSFLRLSSPIS